MKYVVLGYHDDTSGGASGPAGPATPAATATTLRYDNGKVFVTAGAAVPGNDRLGEVLIIDANDLNHAIALMSHSRLLDEGRSIEIRPIDVNDDAQQSVNAEKRT